MKLNQYLQEVELGATPEINQIFNLALKQVFSQSYISKIENTIKKTIKIKEQDLPGEAVAASKGNIIYIDKEEFNKKEKNIQVLYLIHEFLHLLQQNRSFFMISKFKELNDLGKNLKKIITKNLLKPMNVFLSGKNMRLGSSSQIKKEIIPYLILNSIDWKAITEKGKQEVWETLRRSGMFNTAHGFWNKRFIT